MHKITDLYNLNSFHRNGITGKGINTAVLDTGIAPHRDLISNIIYFHDVVNFKLSPYDDNSHGTHVSGIIGSSGISSKKHIGIAPDSGIIGVKVLDKSGHGNPETIITAPGISRKVITVGSCQWNNTKSRDSRALFSGKGPTLCNIMKPDIVAPGDNITSCGPNNTYTTKSGTSMSTPVVSGAAALLYSHYSGISNSGFKNLLHLSAKDIGLDRFTQGYGRLDIEKLFILANPVT